MGVSREAARVWSPRKSKRVN
ncbi:hypothetical protein BN13_1240013 [Nostocoides jenkinsii Ben 74]|uniref:Uncharacterized protein n=1 Tax=Nostocoides jenkinsii Ben 74 TaxID=1193518 RepID=A0A077M5G5_9MICO|nr:hypothetical protein BN13_1240013 [Tetrasphaera jenkinsii Ben 74]